jgi:hypothetical protein
MKYVLAILFLMTAEIFCYNDSLNVSKTDTTKHIIKKPVDTLITYHLKPFDETSTFINSETIYKNDYRYTGDNLTLFPFSFSRDLGIPGMPNEVSIYGNGFNSISFFENGTLLNNRFSNTYDLNNFQSEDIDSIEVVRSPRGFLYGLENNNTSVNFIDKDFVSPAPYSRVKYYEGLYGEAFVDARFNTFVFKKFDFAFDISNKKSEDRFTNTSYSFWQGKFKLKYFLSDKINLIANYFYQRSDVSLNGGINLDSMALVYPDPETEMYSVFNAIVKYNDRYQIISLHNASVRMLGEIIPKSQTDFSVYYQFGLTQFRQDQIYTVGEEPYVDGDRKYKVMGTVLKQEFNTGLINIEATGNFERRILFESNTLNQLSENIFSISGMATLNDTLSIIRPSIFAKSALTSNNSYHGIGGDITVKLNDELKLYGGISRYKYFNLNYDYQQSSDVNSFEASLDYNGNNLSSSVDLFYKNYSQESYLLLDTLPKTIAYYQPKEMMGLGVNLNYLVWVIGLEGHGALYKNKGTLDINKFQPDYVLNFGIYYKNILFDSSLNLKTGFIFYLKGKQTYFDYDYYRNTILFYPGNGIINNTFKVDFFAAGEIQKVAIVYFTWENLFDQNYYITPYYPMPGRGIRFGISWEFLN